MKMSNTIIEDLLAWCLKIKEIIDASIARIDSIRNDKADEETSAKEAKESSYEGAYNIIARGTNRTHKLALASDFQEGLIRPLIFSENSQNNTMATTITTWCPQKGFNEEHGIREFKIIQSNTLRTRVYKYSPMRPWTTKLPITVNGGIQQTASSTISSYQDCVKEEPRATISAMNEYIQHNINGLTYHMSLNNINQNDIDDDGALPNRACNRQYQHNINGFTFHMDLNNVNHDVINLPSVSKNEDDPSCDDSVKQQVLYDPSVHGGGEIESCPDPISYQPASYQPISYQPPYISRNNFRNQLQRVLPAVAAAATPADTAAAAASTTATPIATPADTAAAAAVSTFAASHSPHHHFTSLIFL
nr:methyl-CpG-binding domain-containing protein 2-like isoform X1 [Tanacetum cinerariifolium]